MQSLRYKAKCKAVSEKKAWTTKRDAVEENAHILVIGFQNSDFKSKVITHALFEIKISQFGYAELEILGKV